MLANCGERADIALMLPYVSEPTGLFISGLILALWHWPLLAASQHKNSSSFSRQPYSKDRAANKRLN